MARRHPPTVEALVRGMLSLREKRGRELAIMGASWIEAALEVNIRVHIEAYAEKQPRPELFTSTLRHLEARLAIADAFGMLGGPAVREAIDQIRRVRNEFAHSIDDIDCDSPAIATIIGAMTLSPVEASVDTLIDPSVGFPAADFVFEGEMFPADSIHAICDQSGEVVFFVPYIEHPTTNDDRLRGQIYTSIVGVLGFGMRDWMIQTGRGPLGITPR